MKISVYWYRLVILTVSTRLHRNDLYRVGGALNSIHSLSEPAMWQCGLIRSTLLKLRQSFTHQNVASTTLVAKIVETPSFFSSVTTVAANLLLI